MRARWEWSPTERPNAFRQRAARALSGRRALVAGGFVGGAVGLLVGLVSWRLSRDSRKVQETGYVDVDLYDQRSSIASGFQSPRFSVGTAIVWPMSHRFGCATACPPTLSPASAEAQAPIKS